MLTSGGGEFILISVLFYYMLYHRIGGRINTNAYNDDWWQRECRGHAGPPPLSFSASLSVSPFLRYEVLEIWLALCIENKDLPCPTFPLPLSFSIHDKEKDPPLPHLRINLQLPFPPTPSDAVTASDVHSVRSTQKTSLINAWPLGLWDNSISNE